MTLQLTPDLQQKLEELATQDGRTATELAQEAIGSYLQHIDTLTVEIHEAEEEADRDGWLTPADVMARIEQQYPKTA